MHIERTLVIITLLSSTFHGFAQSNIEEYVKQGIQYHDSGDYDKAINTYKEALAIDPKSTLVNYEIALSYLKKENYEEVLRYSDMVLKQNKEYMLQAYMTKGSALDLLGKTKESNKLFEKAIKKLGGHYLLHYNLGLNHFKKNELGLAEENVIKAIENNPNHSSSHWILANIHHTKGNSVQTLLAVHYFLFLEPNTNRSKYAYQILQENFGGNVTKDPDKPNTINILLSANNDSQFGAAEMMISMLEASKTLEENKNKTEDEMFVENTESFFTILGELKEKKDKNIWWTFYTTFFYDVAQSEHLEVYCKYISQSSNETSKLWLDENKEKLSAFSSWLKN